MINNPRIQLEYELIKTALKAKQNNANWGEKLEAFIKNYIVSESINSEQRKIAHQHLIELFKLALNKKDKNNIYHFILVLSENWNFADGIALLNEQVDDKQLPEIISIVAEHYEKDIVDFIANALGHRIADPKMILELVEPWLSKLKTQPEFAQFWFPNREAHVHYRFEVYKLLLQRASRELRSKLQRSDHLYALVIDLIGKDDEKRLAELIQLQPEMSFHFEISQSEDDILSPEVSPLQLAIERNKPAIVKSLLSQDPSLAKTILKKFIVTNNIKGLHKALSYELIVLFINIPDDKGYVPLHFAAHRGQADIVNELIVHKAALNPTTKSGATPIHKALLHYSHNPEQALSTINTLINNGLDITIGDKSGNNVLSMAIRLKAWDIALRLLQSELCKKLVNKADAKGKTPLHHLLEHLQSGPLPRSAVNVYQTLLKLGGNLCNQDKHGLSPLHYLALSQSSEDEKCFLSLFSKLPQDEKLKMLMTSFKHNDVTLFYQFLTQKRNAQFFQAVIQQLEPGQVVALASKLHENDFSILQYMIIHQRLDVIKMVMEPLTDEQRKGLILQENGKSSLLRLAMEVSKDTNQRVNRESQKIEMPIFFCLLNLLPKREQAEAIHCSEDNERGALTLMLSTKEYQEYFKLVAAHFGFTKPMTVIDFNRLFPQYSVQEMAKLIGEVKELAD